jgi:hypothetical protein
MTNNKLWIEHILKYGAILGFSLSLIEFFALYLGMIFNPVMGFVYIVFVEIILMISIKRYRDHFLSGVIKFTDALLTGIFISLLAGFIWAVYRYIQYSMVPGIIEEKTREIIAVLDESEMNSVQMEYYDLQIKILKSEGFWSFFVTFILNMGVGGTILSLFLASILKRKPFINKPE